MDTPVPPPTSSTATFMPRPNSETGDPGPSAIKIKIVSWNLGDALPKGDLQQLFGPVPSYEPPEFPFDSLPDFGYFADDGHPYHLIIVANQECPTQSGIPRGIGAGVAKGMGGQKEKEKLKERGRLRELKETEKVKEEIKELVGKLGHVTEKVTLEGHLDNQGLLSPTISPHHGHHSIHVNVPAVAKGWSDILEGMSI